MNCVATTAANVSIRMRAAIMYKTATTTAMSKTVPNTSNATMDFEQRLPVKSTPPVFPTTILPTPTANGAFSSARERESRYRLHIFYIVKWI